MSWLSDLFDDIWDFVKKVIVYVLVIIAIVLIVLAIYVSGGGALSATGSLGFLSGVSALSLALLAAMCAVVAYMIDPELAAYLIGKFADGISLVIGEGIEIVAGAADDFFEAMLGGKWTWLLLVGGGYLLLRGGGGDSEPTDITIEGSPA